MAKKQHSKFKYRKRTKEDVEDRKKSSGSMYDQYFKSEFSTFTPKEGAQRLRILPPTWAYDVNGKIVRQKDIDADSKKTKFPVHYGFDIWLHSNVGADNQTYLCHQKMEQGHCPVCEEYQQAQREGDQKYADELKPYKRVVLWVINRNSDDDGPILYACPQKIDIDLVNQAVDPDTGEVLCVDDPEEGYDIIFTREGTGFKTKYTGVQIARRSSALNADPDVADEWLEFIATNPIPTCLQFYDEEHITNVFNAVPPKKKAADDDEDDVDTPKTRNKRKSTKPEPEEEPEEVEAEEEEAEEEEEEAPKTRKRRVIKDEDESLDDDGDDDDADDAEEEEGDADTEEEGDEDDDDGDDEDDKSEDSDDDGDDDEDEEEEAPKVKKDSLRDRIRKGKK